MRRTSIHAVLARVAPVFIALFIALVFFVMPGAPLPFSIPHAAAQEAALPENSRIIRDPAAIKAKLNNLTVYGRYYDGENWIEYHLEDGRTAYWEKGCTYPGKWWVDNGEVCYAYPSYHNGAPNCFILTETAGGNLQFFSLSEAGTPYLASISTHIAPGNAEHLPIGGLSSCVGV